MLTDQALIERVMAGDEGAFEVLRERHGPAIRRRLSRLISDAATVDDLYQEVMLRLWTRADRWHGRGALGGWLTVMAGNLALNHLRSLSRRRDKPSVEERDLEQRPALLSDAMPPEPAAALERRQRQQAMQALLRELPGPRRELLAMVYEQELPIAEIADRIGVPSGPVKSRLHSARSALRDSWRQRHPNEEGEE